MVRQVRIDAAPEERAGLLEVVGERRVVQR
jgi:hypothetical protein